MITFPASVERSTKRERCDDLWGSSGHQRAYPLSTGIYIHSRTYDTCYDRGSHVLAKMVFEQQGSLTQNRRNDIILCAIWYSVHLILIGGHEIVHRFALSFLSSQKTVLTYYQYGDPQGRNLRKSTVPLYLACVCVSFCWCVRRRARQPCHALARTVTCKTNIALATSRAPTMPRSVFNGALLAS